MSSCVESSKTAVLLVVVSDPAFKGEIVSIKAAFDVQVYEEMSEKEAGRVEHSTDRTPQPQHCLSLPWKQLSIDR